MTKATAAVARWSRGAAGAIRHPGRALDELTGPGPVYALLILFGLNAVDELDRTAFGILLPEIRDEFGLDLTRASSPSSRSSAAGALALQVPIAHVRRPRTDGYPWRSAGRRSGPSSRSSPAWRPPSSCSASPGPARASARRWSTRPTTRCSPTTTHPCNRPGVYSFHRAANAVGPVPRPARSPASSPTSSAGGSPFFVFAVPTIIFVVLGLRCGSPSGAATSGEAMGASEEVVDTEEEPPSFAEALAHRLADRDACGASGTPCRSSPRRSSASSSLASLFYEEVFDLDERARGFVAAARRAAPARRPDHRRPRRHELVLTGPGPDPAVPVVDRRSAAAVLAAVFALAPNVRGGDRRQRRHHRAAWPSSVPGILASALAGHPATGAVARLLHRLAVGPPRAARSCRSSGPSPTATASARDAGHGPGVPHRRADPRLGRRPHRRRHHAGVDGGRGPVRGRSTSGARARPSCCSSASLDVGYDDVQVLFGVDLEVDEGEIVALLGTNGAGKSTLLKAISGSSQADGGAIIFDGRDITHAPPDEIAGPRRRAGARAGQGVFPSLTVAENLRLAGWLRPPRRARGHRGRRSARVLEHVPGPARRGATSRPATCPAASSRCSPSAWRFIAQPRLLMIDELSLGLAPVVVEQLLAARARDPRRQGTTVILVEQSVNVALTVADRAYFMEKGEIRFHGPTAELLERPDVLRSVFLEGAAADGAAAGRRPRSRPRRPPPWPARTGPTDDGPALGGRAGVDPVASAASAPSTTSTFDVPPRARSSASSARTAPARRRCSTSSPASRPPTRARSCSAADGHHRALRRRRGPRRGPGPLVPGRPAVPGAHRRRDHRRRARALRRRARPARPRRCTCRRSFDTEEHGRASGSTS